MPKRAGKLSYLTTLLMLFCTLPMLVAFLIGDFYVIALFAQIALTVAAAVLLMKNHRNRQSPDFMQHVPAGMIVIPRWIFIFAIIYVAIASYVFLSF